MKHSTLKRQEIIFTGKSIVGFVILMSLMILNAGCNKDSLQNVSQNDLKKLNIPIAADYRTVVLVADVDGYNAARIDPNLVIPWGIAVQYPEYKWKFVGNLCKTTCT